MSAALEIIDRAIDAITAEIERLTHSSELSELVHFHWLCRLAELQNLRADVARAERDDAPEGPCPYEGACPYSEDGLHDSNQHDNAHCVYCGENIV